VAAITAAPSRRGSLVPIAHASRGSTRARRARTSAPRVTRIASARARPGTGSRPARRRGW
jgi:hypothetical protein